MSIIYDALQKTQQNRKTLRVAERKVTWVDIVLITIIVVLFVMVAVAYFPKLFKHKKVQAAQVAVPAQVAKVPPKIIPVTTVKKLPATPAHVVTPIVVKHAPKPKLVSSPDPIIVKSTPVATVPQPVAHPPVEQLFSPPKHGAVRSDAANTTAPVIPTGQTPVYKPRPAPPSIGMVAPQPVPQVSQPVPETTQAPAPQLSQSAPPVLVQHPSLPIADYVGNLILNGVFETDQDKIALINNQSYHIGDTVGGMKIVSMEMDSVKLRNDKNIFILRVIG